MSVYLECSRCGWMAPHDPKYRPGSPCAVEDCGGHLVGTSDLEELRRDYDYDDDYEDGGKDENE